MRRGLTPRILVASVLLAVVVASTFAYLRATVRDEAASSREARHIRSEMATADQLERQLIELDRDARGFALTGDPRFLVTWETRRDDLLAGLADLAVFVDDEREARLVDDLRTRSRDYLDEVLVPLIDETEVGTAPTGLGQLLRPENDASDTVLERFEEFQSQQAQLLASRLQGSNDATRRGTIAAVIGVAGSIVLVACCSGYLVRVVLRPLRRASTMADRLAGGDLTVRLGEDGPGEIGQLERSFNTMGRALEVGRDRLVALADEQAALHRVAALVATGAAPVDLFDAVVAEVDRLMGSDATVLLRFDPAHTATMIASRELVEVGRPVGTTWSYEGDDLISTLADGDRSSRVGSIGTASGPTAEMLRARGMRSFVGAPIIVDRRVWGAVIVMWLAEVDDPTALGRQVGEFTELVGTAIANADGRHELAASRVRLVLAADEARRRIERDIHDGAQQRLISLGLEVRLVELSVPEDAVGTRDDLRRIGESLAEAVETLQEVARGIHPAILSHGGLVPALRSLARRSPVPTTITSSGDRRLGETTEVAAYYAVSEALTNVAKHAHATSVAVAVDMGDDDIRIVVYDDGVGGADPRIGTGLIGLQDRIEAVGGRIEVDSPVAGGTRLAVWIPDVAPRPID